MEKTATITVKGTGGEPCMLSLLQIASEPTVDICAVTDRDCPGFLRPGCPAKENKEV